MKILITGASGFVGSNLLSALKNSGIKDIRVLTRDKRTRFSEDVEVFEWDINNNFIEEGALKGVDGIIHLAGAGIADARWSSSRKEEILNSRVKSTKLLLDNLEKNGNDLKVFISASAIGIYGDSLLERFDEFSRKGNGYLSEVCYQWEKTLLDSKATFRKSVLRTGIVLGKSGGALDKMKLPFLMGVGGKLGKGNQHMSWIHIHDLCSMYVELLKNENLEGAFNGVSPLSVTNVEFTKTFGSVVSRPTIFPVPGFVLKTALGELSEILLKGQDVYPKRFLDETAFKFKYSKLEDALRNSLEIKSKLKETWAMF